MNTAQKESNADNSSSSTKTNPRQTIYEMIEEASYLVLEQSAPLLNYVTELVATGKTPEEIVEIIMAQSNLPQHRVAYLGCAALYIQKINSLETTGGVS